MTKDSNAEKRQTRNQQQMKEPHEEEVIVDILAKNIVLMAHWKNWTVTLGCHHKSSLKTWCFSSVVYSVCGCRRRGILTVCETVEWLDGLEKVTIGLTPGLVVNEWNFNFAWAIPLTRRISLCAIYTNLKNKKISSLFYFWCWGAVRWAQELI